MINLNAISSPRLLKATVREQAYANSTVERETIAAADAAADAVVARYTNELRVEATERMERGSALLTDAAELNKGMVFDVRAELDRGGDLTALAATYERLESRTRSKITELRQEAAKAELLADRLDSPEDEYERLIERLPALRRGIQW